MRLKKIMTNDVRFGRIVIYLIHVYRLLYPLSAKTTISVSSYRYNSVFGDFLCRHLWRHSFSQLYECCICKQKHYCVYNVRVVFFKFFSKLLFIRAFLVFLLFSHLIFSYTSQHSMLFSLILHFHAYTH